MAELRPITRDEAHAFIRQKHRHHGAPVGELWRHALHDDDGVLVAVATVGRPVARALDDGLTVEITRLCSDGEPNACSMLYGAARRVADAKGYRRGLTYILASESGASVRAAGYRKLWAVDGRSWNCASRPRTDKHPTEDKIAYGWGAWPATPRISRSPSAWLDKSSKRLTQPRTAQDGAAKLADRYGLARAETAHD